MRQGGGTPGNGLSASEEVAACFARFQPPLMSDVERQLPQTSYFRFESFSAINTSALGARKQSFAAPLHVRALH